MNEKKNTLLETVPAAGELRKVPGFNPLHHLRQAVSKTGEKVLKLELPYKKLWFRMACPRSLAAAMTTCRKVMQDIVCLSQM